MRAADATPPCRHDADRYFSIVAAERRLPYCYFDYADDAILMRYAIAVIAMPIRFATFSRHAIIRHERAIRYACRRRRADAAADR